MSNCFTILYYIKYNKSTEITAFHPLNMSKIYFYDILYSIICKILKFYLFLSVFYNNLDYLLKEMS